MRNLAATAAALTLLLAASGPAAAQAPAPLAEGKQLFESVCGTCHELARPLGKNKDRAGWEKTVRRMIFNGAKITPEQGEKVAEYLAARSLFQNKCAACHELARPLGASKDPAAWDATVRRMATKKPGHLSEEEIAAIAAYLALERPATP